MQQLIALFEAEKAFYELSYELNNRPGMGVDPDARDLEAVHAASMRPGESS